MHLLVPLMHFPPFIDCVLSSLTWSMYDAFVLFLEKPLFMLRLFCVYGNLTVLRKASQAGIKQTRNCRRFRRGAKPACTITLEGQKP